MKRPMGIVAVLMGMAFIAGCASAPTERPPDVADREKIIWSSQKERPGWTMEEPEASDGKMFFVGLSGNMATEQLGRADARRNATSNVVAYMGTVVKEKFERARIDFGLASSVVDPTSSARVFEKQLSANVARRLKVRKWYEEKWQIPTGIAWRVFAFAEIPQEAIDDAYKSTASDMAKKAEQRAKEEADKTAKAQLEKASEMWKQMKEQGLFE